MVPASDTRPMQSALIVDDHPLFCDALAMTLKSVAGIEEIETADRLETAIHRVDLTPAPDAIVLDLNLPDVNGIDGADPAAPGGSGGAGAGGVLAGGQPGHRGLPGSWCGGCSCRNTRAARCFARPSMRCGKAAASCPRGTSRCQRARPRARPRKRPSVGLALLTRQQAKILQLICEGLLNKQIAYELSIAETTVKAHVTAIMRKLGVQSRTQAVLLARETNFTSLMPEDG